MKQSALFLALILIGINQPAHGNELVVAEEDGSASIGKDDVPAASMMEEAADLVTVEPAPETVTPAPTDGIDEQKEFDRLFGHDPMATTGTQRDQAIIQQAAGAAWPWWSWPVGLFALGALLIVRSRVNKQELPNEAIRVVSRQPLGKDGALALIELNDGDARTRRLLVGLGGGSPRLVADVSAWEVAVAAPSNIMNDAVAVMGPDPDQGVSHVPPSPVTHTPEERSTPNLWLASQSFGSHLSKAAQRYDDAAQTSPSSADRQDLIEDVLAKRERVRRESVGERAEKKSYSSREILA